MVLFWTTIAALNILAYLMPKSLPGWQLYTTSLFAVMFQMSVDVYFDLKLDLYGYFNKGVDKLGYVYEFGIFPAVSILFLNGWVTKNKIWSKIVFIFVWSCFCTAYEFCALKSGYFYYNGWKLWYSSAQYPFLFLILISNLRIIQWLHNRSFSV